MNIEDEIAKRHKLDENSVDGEKVVEDMRLLITLIRFYRTALDSLISPELKQEIAKFTISKETSTLADLEPLWV